MKMIMGAALLAVGMISVARADEWREPDYPLKGWYAGGDLGGWRLRDRVSGVSLTGFTYSPFSGYQLNRYLGAECAYIGGNDTSTNIGAVDLSLHAQAVETSIIGSLPLDQPTSRARIASWRHQPSMLGLRYTFLHDPTRQWLADGTIDWLWEEAEKAGVPIAMLATDSLLDIARIAERYPGLRLTIDHLGGRGGLTTLKDHEAMTHMPQLVALAKYPNIAVKATGAPGYSAQAYPFSTMQTYLRQIYDAFGPQRMFWGTDISKMPCSWRQCVTMFTEQLSWLSEPDKRLVMGEALCAWWGWQRSA